jgi:hypothetical protein
VLVEPFLRRFVVIRRYREETGDAPPRHFAGSTNQFPGVISAGAGQHRHLAAGLLDNDLHDPQPLDVGERRALAGGSTRAKEMHARVNLPARQPPDRCIVELTAFRERGYQRGSDSCKWLSHCGPPPGPRRSAIYLP